MIDLNKKYKNRFDDLELSEQESTNMINKITHTYNKYQKRKKYFLCVMVLTLLGFLGIGVVYADDIADFVKGYNVTKTTENEKDKNYSHTNGESSIIKELDYNADLPETKNSDSHYNEYTIEELENLLKIKILRSDYYKTTTLKQISTIKTDGKIAAASFNLDNFSCTEQTNKLVDRYNLHIYFSTKYNQDGGKVTWETGRDTNVTEYYLKNLNTTAYILHPKSQNRLDSYTVHFIYDNIGYSLRLRITDTEIEDREIKLKAILDSFKMEA